MRHKPDVRKELLIAGTQAIHLNGYNGTGIKDIVDAAGVPKGSFYNYFPSKEDFAIEALRQTADQAYARIEALLTNDELRPLDRIATLFSSATKEIIAEGSYSKGCIVGNLCQEMADTNERIAKEAERIFKRMRRALATCLREAQTAGDMSPAKDANTLAEFIFNSWEGSLMRMKASKSPAPLHAFTKVLLNDLFT